MPSSRVYAILQSYFPQIYSLAIARLFLTGLPFTRSSLHSAILGRYATSDSLSTKILTCHRQTLADSVFLGSAEFSRYNYKQFLNHFSKICSLAIAWHSLWQGLPLAWLNLLSANFRQLGYFRITLHRIITCHHPTLSLTAFALAWSNLLSSILGSWVTSELHYTECSLATVRHCL